MTLTKRSKVASETLTLRFTPAQLKKLKALGGGKWLRNQLNEQIENQGKSALKINPVKKSRGKKK